jgi:RNA polymerase-binding transcription factor DksA
VSGDAADFGSPAAVEAPAQPPAAVEAPAQPPAGGESDEALLERMSAELDGIERMLGRLDDGSFATCEVCGAELGRERLLADPVLTRCPAH